MIMKKAIFLDRDGTINIDKGYLYKIDDFEFIPGVIDGLKLLTDAGFVIVIITNQSGIARGMYSEQDLIILNTWLSHYLHENGVSIGGIYYCPHHPNGVISKYRKQCDCRKPGLELYYTAVRELNINLDESYAIGDKLHDCCICYKTKCKGFLIGANEDDSIIRFVRDGQVKNVKYKEDLLHCAIEIVSKLK